jgi:NADPH2:quinone reductase
MRAVLCERFCEPRELVLKDLPPYRAAPGKVVVDIKACGVNFFDGLRLQGRYQSKAPFPFTPGAEMSGVIREVGDDVTGLAPGMRVLSFAGLGGYAEQALVDAWRVCPIPDEMDFVTAAGFAITYGTAYHAIKDRAALAAGETLLVLGAAGGVGLAAVEIGRSIGARVIAAASSPEKLALCRRHGAEQLIDYASDDLRERLKQLFGNRGVDVVLDPVGDRYAEPAVRSLAWKGRYLVIGFAAGDIPKIPLNLPLLKMASILGVFWGEWVTTDPAANAANNDDLLGLYRAGKLRPHIGATFLLDRAADALDLVMQRGALGKVIIVTDPALLRARAADA